MFVSYIILILFVFQKNKAFCLEMGISNGHSKKNRNNIE